MGRVALFTAIYPAALKHVGAWHASVRAQTEREFDVWIMLDGVSVDEAAAAAGADLAGQSHRARAGASPAEVRNQGLLELLDRGSYDTVVLVDCDDILLPERVARAVSALQSCDAYACAMELVDEQGRTLGQRFGPAGDWSTRMLARENVFGFSNTAYRASALRAALPVPPETAAVDWLVATRVAAAGAAMQFDATPGMAYRQHAANVVRVLPPFTPADVRPATEIVLQHYSSALAGLPAGEWHTVLGEAQADVVSFRAYISDDRRLEEYVAALNRLAPRLTWWSAVARRELERLWKH